MEHRRYHQTEQQYANERVSRYTEGLKRGDLQELYFYANFVGYTITPDKKKIPLNPRTGKAASPTDPETWGTLAEALRFLKNGYDNEITRRHEWPNGLGFALSHTPFTAIDLDRRVAGNRSLY